MAARYGTTVGKKGPKSDFAAPITREQPMAASDTRQYISNTKTNRIIDEFGVTKGLPRQQIVPPNGGKFSGRTGPIS